MEATELAILIASAIAIIIILYVILIGLGTVELPRVGGM